MAVTFVIGRAGSGKTTRCFRRIVEAMRADPLGPPIFWIVPKQATFMAERDLTCDSGLGAFCRARVLSFDQLAALVFDQCGGSAVPEVTPLGRQMILGHLLRRLQPRLGYFRSVARQPGLAAELDSTFAELERCGKGAGDLSELVAELEASDPADVDGGSLAAKLQDLRLLYDTYQSFLGQDRLDPHRRMTQVLERMADCPLLRGATAYVDGFLDFTDAERRTLAVLGKSCSAVEIALLLDPDSPTFRDPHKLPDDASLFRRTEDCYRKLWFTFEHEGVAVTEPVVLRDTPRFARAPALGTIERAAFADAPSGPRAEPREIEMITAPDRDAEVEAVARRIRTLLPQGMRFRDVALLVRDLDDYHGKIDATFREHGIPYFVDRRRTASHHPLLQFVRSVFQIARFDWPHDATIGLLKTGLACLTPDEADEVEDYVLLHRIRGGTAWESAEPWAYRRDLTRAGEISDEGPNSADPVMTHTGRVDRLRRRVSDHLRPLLEAERATDPPTLRRFVRLLSELFERCGVRRTLADWMEAAVEAGDLEQRGEHEQVWSELTGLLEQMANLLGDEPVTASEFAEILESGLERFDLALTPPTVDQVLVGQVDRTRTPPGLRAVFVMGLNAGEFPRAARDRTVLSDTERRELRRRRVDIEGDGRRELLDERLLGYFAFTRASERLFLSRPLTSDGERLAEPSPFWQRLRDLFPDLTPAVAAPVRAAGLADAWTPRQVVVSLMEWVRDGTAPGDDDQLAYAACYQWLATQASNVDGMRPAVARAWPALAYVNTANLSQGVSSALFPAPLTATAARLETFAACPFRHFLRYGLEVSEREAQGVTALDLSRVYHHVLEKLVAAAIRDGIDLSDPATPVPEELIHHYARQIGRALRGELMLSSARNEYLLARVERTLREVIAAHREMMRRGQFRPAKSAVKFEANAGANGRQSLSPVRVTTPRGDEIVVEGRIDRVDLLPGGVDVAVFDYRLGSRSLSLQEVYHGLSLQLLTSLLALQGAEDRAAGRSLTPAAAFYLQMARGIGEVKHPSEALDPSDPKYLLRVKPRGVFDGSYLPGFDASLAPGSKSDVLQVQITNEGKFGNRRSSDVADRAEFRGLLTHVREQLAALADGILGGEIGVRPYRLNLQTPCPSCGYRSVCRFDPAVDRYRNLTPLSKEQVLEAVAEKADEGGTS